MYLGCFNSNSVCRRTMYDTVIDWTCVPYQLLCDLPHTPIGRGQSIKNLQAAPDEIGADDMCNAGVASSIDVEEAPSHPAPHQHPSANQRCKASCSLKQKDKASESEGLILPAMIRFRCIAFELKEENWRRHQPK